MNAIVSQLDINRVPRIDPADYCDCGEALNRSGECFRCDRCHCANVDKGTGYMECCMHPAPMPVPDALARLKSLMCRCTSDEFARPVCAVHGKA